MTRHGKCLKMDFRKRAQGPADVRSNPQFDTWAPRAPGQNIQNITAVPRSSSHNAGTCRAVADHRWPEQASSVHQDQHGPLQANQLVWWVFSWSPHGDWYLNSRDSQQPIADESR
jgi:hypothetical protein